MLKTLTTLMRARVAEEEEALIDRNAATLLNQKIRDCEAGLSAAKATLATTLQQERLAARQLGDVRARIADLTARAEAALSADDSAMLTLAAEAIADLEGEETARAEASAAISARAARLRASVEKAHRRLRDLRQGAAMARAAARETRAQSRLSRAPSSDFAEAEDLVARILGQDDPFELDEIRAGLEAELDTRTAADRLAAAGYGPRRRSTPADVIARLKSANPKGN